MGEPAYKTILTKDGGKIKLTKEEAERSMKAAEIRNKLSQQIGGDASLPE